MQDLVPLAGFEPAIYGLEDRCLIHLATEAEANEATFSPSILLCPLS